MPLAFGLEFANAFGRAGRNLPTPLAFCGNGLTDKTREKA
jgi:hypothetical protein